MKLKILLLVCFSLLFTGCVSDNYFFLSYWTIDETTGYLEPITFEENRTVRVFDLIVESPNSIVIGGFVNDSPFATIGASDLGIPIANLSRRAVVVTNDFFSDRAYNGTAFMSVLNRDEINTSNAIISAADFEGNGMALVKYNKNFFDPYLNQVSGLRGNLDILTTINNNVNLSATPNENNIRIGFYEYLDDRPDFSIVEYVNKTYLLEMNLTSIKANQGLYFKHLNDTEVSAISGHVGMFCQDDDKCYLRQSDGTKRRLVDAGAGSFVFDETIKFNTSEVVLEHSSFNQASNAFVCMNSTNNEIFTSTTACDLT